MLHRDLFLDWFELCQFRTESEDITYILRHRKTVFCAPSAGSDSQCHTEKFSAGLEENEKMSTGLGSPQKGSVLCIRGRAQQQPDRHWGTWLCSQVHRVSPEFTKKNPMDLGIVKLI